MADMPVDFTVPSDLPVSLPVLALRRGVLLPGVVMPLKVGRPRSVAALDKARDELIIVAAQREAVEHPSPSDILSTGVLARVIERRRGKGVPDQILVQGLARVSLTGFPATHPFMEATFSYGPQTWPDTPEAEAMWATFQQTVSETLDVIGAGAAMRQVVDSLKDNPTLVVDATAGAIQPVPEGWRAEVLQTRDPLVRAQKVLERLVHAKEVIAAQKSIRDRVQTQTKDYQREAVLRQQLKAIQSELGEGDEDELSVLKDRLKEARLPEEVSKVVDRELKRLDRLNSASPERSVAIDWLEWIADIPWSVQSAVDVDLNALEQALERSHFGLDEVKRQVVEHLSVRKLAGKGRADVLLLVGPPGVGKTSIGSAIADATGRKLVRVALGGIRDEAELRGHRRTYIGARPGRLVEGIRRAGTSDPVVLLDEVDKLSSGMMGNPAAALLEILDPEQNHAFTDRYLEVPLDLSRTLFIATANDLSSIPGPLRDRMEILEIAGYSPDEKQVIAREHLLEKLAENAGIAPDQVEISDGAIAAAIAGWTREAGVRELQRVLGKVYRAAAVKVAKGEVAEGPLAVDVDDLSTYLGRRKFEPETHDAPNRPGIATGLAWSPVGGNVLYIETSTLPGTGKLLLTGQLGDVMQESARAALTYVLANRDELGIPHDALDDLDVHVHFPAGAVPKDGPSAGVTIFTALASLLSGRPVRDDVAMTGEATLRGRVLPVGGIKSKVLAAHRRGLKRIILPRQNERDIEDIPESARNELEFILVDHMEEALAAALMPPTKSGARRAA